MAERFASVSEYELCENCIIKQLLNVWFQKISIPPPWRELEIPKGRGVKDPGNSRGKGGCMIALVSRGFLIQFGFECRSSCSKILSYLK